MEKRMTSGEIAKKTGVSQKTVRLYDEKGLLKPSGYSEGNYRLYDNEALAVLEKAIAGIHSVLLRKTEPDWDSVAEIVKTMQMDQGADVNHFQALLHNAGQDWYVTIYKSLGLRENARVLDLGCGYGKLWRNNWAEIPAGVTVDGYDLHGSWADDFAEYAEEHKESLADGTEVKMYFEDVEEAETWKGIEGNVKQCGCYDLVIAHYLLDFIKDKEAFSERMAKVLAPEGMCSINGASVSREHAFWQEIFGKLQLKTDFLTEREIKALKMREEFRELLSRYFSKVENTTLGSLMRYTDGAELFAYLLERYPEAKKYLTEKEQILKEYFISEIKEKGAFLVLKSTDFQHCFK